MMYSVVTTGSALAAALSSIVISKEGFGLLIGTKISSTSELLQDTAEPEVTQHQQLDSSSLELEPINVQHILPKRRDHMVILQVPLAAQVKGYV
ncbi:hypothetical protein WJX79_008264 [Trebouxia sp. C0005]